MTLESALLFLTTLFFFSIKPGPGLMALFSLTLRSGLGAALCFQLAAIIIEVIYFTLAACGYSLLAENMPFVVILIRTLGAAYLIYLGVKGFEPRTMTAENVTSLPNRFQSLWDGFCTGLIMTIGNPVTIIFYASIIPLLFDTEMLSLKQILIGINLILVVLIPVYFCNAMFAEGLRRILSKPKNYALVSLISSLVMIAAGLIIGFSVFIEIFWT